MNRCEGLSPKSRQNAYAALTLIGVVHRDPDGHRILAHYLRHIKPRAICVELSPYGLTWRERRGGELRKRLDHLLDHIPRQKRTHHQVQLIREALALPFEYTASLAFAKSHRIPVHCIDLNGISRWHLPLLESAVINRENLIALSGIDDAPLEAVVQRAYRSALRCLDDANLTSDWEHELDRRRERFMACRVRRLSDKFRRVVYVGGWRHLVEDMEGLSLASLLRDISPARVLLHYGILPPMKGKQPGQETSPPWAGVNPASE